MSADQNTPTDRPASPGGDAGEPTQGLTCKDCGATLTAALTDDPPCTDPDMGHHFARPTPETPTPAVPPRVPDDPADDDTSPGEIIVDGEGPMCYDVWRKRPPRAPAEGEPDPHDPGVRWRYHPKWGLQCAGNVLRESKAEWSWSGAESFVPTAERIALWQRLATRLASSSPGGEPGAPTRTTEG